MNRWLVWMARHVVTDVTSFLRAIGSDRTIELAAGEYLLDPAAAAGQTSRHWQFDEVSDGRQLVLIGVTNLTIRGRGLETPVRVRPRYAAVLSFRWVQGLRLENLHLSHNQGSNVLRAWDSSDLLFRDCRIQRNRFTCSTPGYSTMFWVFRVTGVRVERCVFGPDQANYLVSNLGPVLFEDCEFADNTWRRGKYEPHQPPPPADYRGN